MTAIAVTIETPGRHTEVIWTLPCVLGRHDGSGGIDDDAVSRRHAELHWDDAAAAVAVTDLGSRNGMMLDGQRVVQAIWTAGTSLTAGSSTLRWRPRTPISGTELLATLRDELALLDPADAQAQRAHVVARATEACGDPADIQSVVDELFGFGPLEGLLADPEITEILVCGTERIWVERAGRLEPVAAHFRNAESLRGMADRMLRLAGRSVDLGRPFADARLPDGSRLHVVIPPIALDGVQVTIRKFAPSRRTLADLADGGALDSQLLELLRQAVADRRNIVVSGGTGSGKTTLLGALAACCGQTERIVTIEDAAELQLPLAHVVRLEARPAGAEDEAPVTIRDLVRNALRMRPDRLIIGECRGGEAFDMLQAMNTGHDGSMTTMHANSPRDALARLESLVLMAEGGLPHRAVREQVMRAVDLIVQTVRTPDGRRRITEAAAPAGLEGDVPVLRALYSAGRTPC
jgi:pilus assembly protein CpaF